MGRRGPRPQPTRLKMLKGNPGKRKLNDAEPEPRETMPACPSHLSAMAKAEWRRTAKVLHRLGLLTEIDGPALSLYCDAWARWVEAKKKVGENGMCVVTTNGNPIQNPYLAIANKAATQMMKMQAEFGMTPSSRSGVVTEKHRKPPMHKRRFFE